MFAGIWREMIFSKRVLLMVKLLTRRPRMVKNLLPARTQLVRGDGGEDDQAFDDLLPEGRDVEEEQAVVQHADDEAAEHRAANRAASAGERCAANDDRRDGIEFVAEA